LPHTVCSGEALGALQFALCSFPLGAPLGSIGRQWLTEHEQEETVAGWLACLREAQNEETSGRASTWLTNVVARARNTKPTPKGGGGGRWKREREREREREKRRRKGKKWKAFVAELTFWLRIHNQWQQTNKQTTRASEEQEWPKIRGNSRESKLASEKKKEKKKERDLQTVSGGNRAGLLARWMLG